MRIRYLIMDVDGTLTDGKIYMDIRGEVYKAFDVKDGYGIRNLLPLYGIIPIIITGRTSEIVNNRCQDLGITMVFQGVSNKLDLLKSLNICADEIAYIGDDLNDYECIGYIKANGDIVGCPQNEVLALKEDADFVSVNDSGQGAVRDFIDWLINRIEDVE